MKRARMMDRMLRRMALMIPRVRRLVESRDEALATSAALAAALAARAAPTVDLRDMFRSFLSASSAETWLLLGLNGAPVWLPRDTLLTMYHCIHRHDAGAIYLSVEEAHLKWMMQQLGDGGTFLDVGAATGATTLPIAVQFGNKVRIVSYEPAEKARALLLDTLRRNDIRGVDVRSVAVSDAPGTAEFREFLPDETGAVPYLPETSTLIGPIIHNGTHRTLTVPVVTLDTDAMPCCDRDPVVVKIDVEGFEAWVLRGAEKLIMQRRPWLSIDIHAEPFGDGKATREQSVRALLGQQGYRFDKLGHVLLCTPPTAAEQLV